MTSDDQVTRGAQPRMTLGTMYFGTTVPQDVAERILDEAYDSGVRSWDTANNYAFWVRGGSGDESEQCLGRWFRRHPERRDEISLATKVGARPRPGARDLDEALGLSPAAIDSQLRASLRRSAADHVDLLYAHIDDTTVPLADTLGAMEELRQAGLVRRIGASNLTASRLRTAIEVGGHGGGYRFLQQRFSYLWPAADADIAPHVLLDEAVVAECSAAGIAMLGYSPLLSGAYTRADRPLPSGYATQHCNAMLQSLADVAAWVGLDMGQTVLAWMGQRSTPVWPVVGVSTPEQLRSAVTAVETRLPDDALAALDAARMEQ
ncbi:aldo/keto reductase [Tsukamurella sp. 8F]|uniref:aldo/keto reductase n=1 Tax=unclassified Tsukamurella TaxID=2633480 RepID=UPI0023B9C51A|nr:MULTISPECIES: aldo/keto reductase [unclassified Tsukamurella]MDF0530414.1 aldo/keto reductase [Tsukamurella sp. 8J]MDF0587765.1 aldo/keto reductase [Tsukamurella sp. 8F]